MGKLVRDRMPAVWAEHGHPDLPTYHASDAELHGLLKVKLLEEIGEFLVEPSAEEAGDVLEVLAALLERENLNLEDALVARQAKLARRGGFKTGLVLGWKAP